MKRLALIIGLTWGLAIGGCGKRDNEPAPRTATSETARAASPSAKTASDQGEDKHDRTTTQKIRQAVVADDTLSTAAHNVTIVTSGGKVILRGAVKNQAEKEKVQSKAAAVAGAENVANELTTTQ